MFGNCLECLFVGTALKHSLLELELELELLLRIIDYRDTAVVAILEEFRYSISDSETLYSDKKLIDYFTRVNNFVNFIKIFTNFLNWKNRGTKSIKIYEDLEEYKSIKVLIENGLEKMEVFKLELPALIFLIPKDGEIIVGNPLFLRDLRLFFLKLETGYYLFQIFAYDHCKNRYIRVYCSIRYVSYLNVFTVLGMVRETVGEVFSMVNNIDLKCTILLKANRVSGGIDTKLTNSSAIERVPSGRVPSGFIRRSVTSLKHRNYTTDGVSDNNLSIELVDGTSKKSLPVELKKGLALEGEDDFKCKIGCD